MMLGLYWDGVWGGVWRVEGNIGSLNASVEARDRTIPSRISFPRYSNHRDTKAYPMQPHHYPINNIQLLPNSHLTVH